MTVRAVAVLEGDAVEMIVGIVLVVIAGLEIALFTRTAAANAPR